MFEVYLKGMTLQKTLNKELILKKDNYNNIDYNLFILCTQTYIFCSYLEDVEFDRVRSTSLLLLVVVVYRSKTNLLALESTRHAVWSSQKRLLSLKKQISPETRN